MPGIRITKPFKLSLLHRTYQYRGEQKLAVGVLGMFSLTEPGRVLPENEMWRKTVGALGRDGMLDAAMPKSRAEFLVSGSFHAPDRRPAPAGYVRVKLGKLDKRINVYGDRHWKRAAGVSLGVSEPAPMESMPLDFAHAFGGKEHKPNPLGRGIDAVEAEGETRVLLPNLELPGALIGSPSDRPPAACYGALDPMWPQRYAKVGTYDQRWLKERAPGLADDLEWSYFNVAAEDQWIEGYWRGDEEFELHNLHPTRALIQGRLPGLVARVFVVHGHGQDERLEELSTRLDTVHFFPGEEGGICIWRGDTRITTDDASDVSQIMIAYERSADPRRSLEHYQEALRRRLDRATRATLLLDERDIIPDGDKSGMAEIIERSIDHTGKEGLLAKHQKERVKLEADKARARLAELGVDMAALPEAPVAPLETPDIAKLVADARRQSEDSRALAKEKLEATCKQLGMDPAVLSDKMANSLPRFSAAERLAIVRKNLALLPEAAEVLKKTAGLPDLEELEAKLQAAEEAFRRSYGLAAHNMVRGLPADRQAGLAALREEVLLRLKRGESLARMDLAGVDLSGIDLKGADLSGAYLEFANFSNADLSGAKLKGAIAARANFSGASLAKTDLSAANLGLCSFVDAQGEGADFSGAVVSEASFEKGRFPGAKFEGGQMVKTDFTAADLSGADFKKPLFMECRLDGTKLNRASLQRAMVIGGSAKGLDLSDARGEALLFVNLDLDGLKAARAEINKLRLVGDETRARGADFGGAKVPGSNLRGIDLAEGNFERAILDGADLSEAKLRQARFQGASAQRAHFMQTDLTGAKLSNCNLKEAMLNKARLVQADLSNSNCFGAEFLGVTVGETRFHGANLKRTKLKDWHP